MHVSIFSLEDYARYLNGEDVDWQHFSDLTVEQYSLLVTIVDSTDTHDWR